MKIFISYKFTGENLSELGEFMNKVCQSLKKNKHEPLTTFWDKDIFEKNKSSLNEIMQTALNYLDKSDLHLIIIKSNEKSEGTLIEYGYSLDKNKRRILVIKKGISTTWLKASL